MKISKQLFTLEWISYILMMAAVGFSIISLLEEKSRAYEFWPMLVFWIGIIGFYSHNILSSLHERIRKLEDINKIDNTE